MKRLISILLICILGILLFMGGCGEPQDSENEEETSSAEISLEVWICYDRNVPGAYYVFEWDNLAEKYGYNIEIQTYSEQEIKDKLKMAVVSNELPDIFYVPGGAYPEYLFEAGACIPVQEYLSETDFKEKYLLPYEDGSNYIISCMADSYGAAYYNTELMAEIGLEIPSNWEELEEMVQKVHQYNEENGTEYAAIELGMKDKWMGELLYCMTALSQNQEIYRRTETGEASDEELSAMLTEASGAIDRLMKLGAFPGEYMEIGEPEAVRNFINQDAVMMVHQTSLVYHLIQNMGREGFAAAAFPGCGEEGALYRVMDMNYTYTPGLAVSSGSEYQEEAARLSVEFALNVNRTNVEQHGYLNMTEEDFTYDGSSFPQIEFIHDLETHAETTDAFLFSGFVQENGDDWGNLMKQFYAGQLDVQEFSENSAGIIKNNNS